MFSDLELVLQGKAKHTATAAFVSILGVGFKDLGFRVGSGNSGIMGIGFMFRVAVVGLSRAMIEGLRSWVASRD